MLQLRVFVSSPGDVGAERGVALAVTERLQFEFRGQVQLETYLWERSLLRATDTFQAQIVDVAEADLALFILWARMGTPLPLDEFSRPDGSQYASGTEYEFERARDAHERGDAPEILCYLKTAEVRLSMPNKHHFVVDLSPFGLDNDNEVFHADDRPYGLIEAAIVEDGAPDPGPAWDPYPML